MFDVMVDSKMFQTNNGSIFAGNNNIRALAACVNRSTHLQGSFLLVTTRDHRQLKNIIEHLLFVRVLVAFVLAHAGSSALISET